MSPQDEPPGRSLEGSSLVTEVAEELQHLQLPGEQPQQGLADDRTDVSNKEPLHKCSGEDNDAIKDTAIVPQLQEEPTKVLAKEPEYKGSAPAAPASPMPPVEQPH